MSHHTNVQWRQLLQRILESSSRPVCRGYQTREVVASTTSINMVQPVLTVAARKIGYRFMCAEAAWVLSGDNHVSTLAPFSKMVKDFSDDGLFFHGAYGPKVVDQLPYILQCLKGDTSSRQAVLNIWREKPGPSKDIPCTLSIQFLIRDGFLDLVDTMRSSDAWLGVPYDWFTFSMVAAYVCVCLRESGLSGIKPGTLTMVAGSQHLYEHGFGYDISRAKKCVVDGAAAFDYRPLDVDEFLDPDDFVRHLWDLANVTIGTEHDWLREMGDWHARRKK